MKLELILLATTALTPWLTACNLMAPLCSTAAAVLREDGGQYRCIQAEDCPRLANVPVCADTLVREKECVACAETRCVRILPKACPP